MLALPVPIIVSLILCTLAMLLFRQKRQRILPIISFLLVSAISTLLVGLRWGYGLDDLRFAQPIAAASLPPLLAWSLSATFGLTSRSQLLGVTIPISAGLMFLISPLKPLLDPFILSVYFGYAIWLIKLGTSNSDGFSFVRFHSLKKASHLCYMASVVLLAAFMIDMLILIDLTHFNGDYTPAILSISHSAIVVLLTATLTVTLTISNQLKDDNNSTEVPEQKTEPSINQASQEDNLTVLNTVVTLLEKQELFCDPDLNLARLARKAGIPSRKISAAVNQMNKQNVSQLINTYRIDKAQTLLVQTRHSVTEIYGMVGFNTKSNFNREFLRQKGMTPSDYRRSAQGT